jgi:hypothetical protein
MVSPIYMQPTVSYRALDKAGATLEPFVDIYFRFYGIKEHEFFKYFPVLTYTESTIYQIDEEYELNTDKENFKSKHMEVLFTILKEKNLLDEKIEQEFANGIVYYGLEQKMCSGKPFTFEDVKRANHFKCFDFRVLHRLLYKLRGIPYNESVLEAFWIGEAMADVEDDLPQYEDDVKRNVYNTYRMIAKLYKQEAPKKLQEYLGELNQQISQALAGAPWKYRTKFKLALKLYRMRIPIPTIPAPILSDCQ